MSRIGRSNFDFNVNVNQNGASDNLDFAFPPQTLTGLVYWGYFHYMSASGETGKRKPPLPSADNRKQVQ
jgi:hypothetical protein